MSVFAPPDAGPAPPPPAEVRRTEAMRHGLSRSARLFSALAAFFNAAPGTGGSKRPICRISKDGGKTWQDWP